MTRKLTNQRIVASTVYLDHASDISYVYHQTSMTSKETLKSKLAFEKFAASHGVNIKHYHADNGRFKDKLFSKSIEERGQTISFCGVGAHHKNGIAEERIGGLERRATTLLLHAQRRWPDAINTNLWTYAIRAANDSRNYAPTNENDTCPMSRFCKTASVPTIQNQHHFGCPTQESEETSTPSDLEIEENDKDNPDLYVTRSGRRSKPPERLIYDANSCLIRPNEHEDKETWSEQDLLAYKASTDPDTMYHHQAMKQPDREKFQEAMRKECRAHNKEGNYRLVKRSELPEGATLLSSV
jgi:hypothetical protein